jgi:hypothetical protein
MAKKKVNKTTTGKKEKVDGGGISIAGFILSLLALVFCWIPFLGLALAVLGIIISAMGMQKGRSFKGLAIAGLIISIVAVIPALIITLGVTAILGAA